MSELDDACDATLAKARENRETSERLAAEITQARASREEWENANGIDAEKCARFFASLPPEQKQVVEDENNTFQRELSEALSTPDQSPPAPRRPGRRNYI